MINEKYSMLIKYKTRRTIIVLSPNSANLINILTQFVYSKKKKKKKKKKKNFFCFFFLLFFSPTKQRQ